MHSDGLAVVVWLPIDVVRCRLPDLRIGDSKADFAGTVVGEAGQQFNSPAAPKGSPKGST